MNSKIKDFLMDCFLYLSLSIPLILCYYLGFNEGKHDLNYYKEKSKKEQRLLWRISYTFPLSWELIKNTPEYHQCIEYNVEELQ